MTLTTEEQRRLMVLNQLGSGAVSSGEAAALVGLSVRQMRRLRRQYEREGAKAVAHGNRGRSPANAVPLKIRRRVVALATTRYQGFNQQHLTEMLAEREQLHLSRPTVRRILQAAGVPSPRRRRPARSHRRRDRFAREGMLLQIDASRHDWLEGRGPWLSLVGGIDDATGQVLWAGFGDQEDARAYFELLRQTVRRKGLPLAVYSDRHSIFFHTADRELSVEEQLAGRKKPTARFTGGLPGTGGTRPTAVWERSLRTLIARDSNLDLEFRPAHSSCRAEAFGTSFSPVFTGMPSAASR